MGLLSAEDLMNEKIFPITKDIERAKDLLYYAEDRISLVKARYKEDKWYKVVEEAYESIKESLTAIMYSEGYKTLSHVKLLEYFNDNHKILSESEKRLVDVLRKMRNGIVYYGEKITKDFLDNNYLEILNLMDKLIKFAKQKVK